jgi:hypothetical protein
MVDLSSNHFVKKQIPKIDKMFVTSTKGKGGMPRSYTPTKMKNSVNRYFEHCEKEDEVPSISGLMIHLKMYSNQFYAYSKYPEFVDLIEHTRLIIANWCENDVYKTKGLATGKIAYMKNVHNWTEKISSENTNITATISVDQARAKIEMLAPKLLELLKNTTVMEQIKSEPVEVDARRLG